MRSGASDEPAYPIAHGGRRQRELTADRPETATVGCSGQGRADDFHPVQPAQQHPVRKDDVGVLTDRAAAAARAQPAVVTSITNPAAAGETPEPQAPIAGATQLSGRNSDRDSCRGRLRDDQKVPP